jgi:transposase-like protein
MAAFTSIIDLIKAFPDEQTCIDHLTNIRWEGNVVSPFDVNSKVYKCKNNRYKCVNTGKYFNVRTQTIFEDTKLPLQKWFMALYIFSSHKKGISSHQLGRDLDITQKSAWFVLHRLRYAFDHPTFRAALKGIIEIDETFVGGESINKHQDKKEISAKGKAFSTKVPVLGMLERGGNVIAFHVAGTKTHQLYPCIIHNIVPEAILMTDDNVSYRGLTRHFKTHQYVNHSAKQYVDGMCHTNGIECFWSHLQRGVTGIYHWVSVPHLQAYVDEFALRYNTRTYETSERFNLILKNVAGKRLTYETLINHE